MYKTINSPDVNIKDVQELLLRITFGAESQEISGRWREHNDTVTS
jgi:hypothetical protein